MEKQQATELITILGDIRDDIRAIKQDALDRFQTEPERDPTDDVDLDEPATSAAEDPDATNDNLPTMGGAQDAQQQAAEPAASEATQQASQPGTATDHAAPAAG